MSIGAPRQRFSTKTEARIIHTGAVRRRSFDLELPPASRPGSALPLRIGRPRVSSATGPGSDLVACAERQIGGHDGRPGVDPAIKDKDKLFRLAFSGVAP
jgi:hypothetical protein